MECLYIPYYDVSSYVFQLCAVISFHQFYAVVKLAGARDLHVQINSAMH